MPYGRDFRYVFVGNTIRCAYDLDRVKGLWKQIRYKLKTLRYFLTFVHGDVRSLHYVHGPAYFCPANKLKNVCKSRLNESYVNRVRILSAYQQMHFSDKFQINRSCIVFGSNFLSRLCGFLFRPVSFTRIGLGRLCVYTRLSSGRIVDRAR